MALPRGFAGASASLLLRAARRGAPLLASRLGRPPEWVAGGRSARGAISAFVAGRDIVVQHVFRLYLMPLADVVRLHLPGIQTQLDLDDLEFETRMRFADLHARRGERGAAAVARRDARFYQAAEAKYLSRADRIWVCSDRDGAVLRERLGANRVAVVPNTVSVSGGAASASGQAPFTFLFVGGGGYFPNRAGVEWFLAHVMPLLRGMAPRPFRVRIVGPPSRFRPLRAGPADAEVELVGFAQDVGPHYAVAGAVVVPIEAGGGTRIKVLEAFAHGRPVVTTPMGVEGLAVDDGVHVLVAADAKSFAEQCRRLMDQPALAAGLVSRARSLYDRCYSPAAVAEAVVRASSTSL
ncbi:MAG: glycosyltransferase [Gemmatimonadaceae bacterium]